MTHRLRRLPGAFALVTAVAALAPGAALAASPIVDEASFSPLNPRAGTQTALTLEARWAWDERWNFGDGTALLDGNRFGAVRHTFTAPGLYHVRYDIADENGAVTGSGPLRVGVHGENYAPAVVLDGGSGVTGREQRVRAYVEDDSPKAGWTYAFDLDGNGAFDDGTPVRDRGNVVAHTFATDGTHAIKVRVSDGQGETTEGRATFETHTANRAPVVVAEDTVVRAGRSVPAWVDARDDYTAWFDLGYEYWLDGEPVAGDAFGPLLEPFETPGEHVVRIRVTDLGHGNEAPLATEKTVKLTVVETLPEGTLAPSVDLYAWGEEEATPVLAPLENASLYANVPRLSPATSVAWDFDADGEYDDALGLRSSFASDTPGTYRVAFRATEPGAEPVSAERTVVVAAPPAAGPEPAPVAPVAPPAPPQATPPAAPVVAPVAPVVPRPAGRLLLRVGAVALTDAVGGTPGRRPGIDARGIDLRAGRMRVGSLFAETPSEVTVDYTATLGSGRARSSAAKHRTLRLGRSRHRLAGGASARLGVTLTRTARKALAGRRTVRVAARVLVRDVRTGKRRVATKSLTLRVVQR